MGTIRRLGFRPRRRLRHLKEIRLQGVPGCGAAEAGDLFFEVHCKVPGEEQELLLAYRSEKVPRAKNVQWSPIELDLSSLAPALLHGHHSGNIVVKVFCTTIGDRSHNEKSTSTDGGHYSKVMDLKVNLNALVPWTFDRGIQFQLVDGCYGTSHIPDFSVALANDTFLEEGSDLERVLSGGSASVSGSQVEGKGRNERFNPVLYCKSCKHVPSVANLCDLDNQQQERRPRSLHSSSSAPNLVPLDDEPTDPVIENVQFESKVYSLAERRADIRRLLTSHQSLCELADRHRRLHMYITEILSKEQKLQQKHLQLKQIRESCVEHHTRRSLAEAKLDRLRSKSYQLRDWNLVRSNGLKEAAGALQGACRRWKDAEEVLAGAPGVGKLQDLQLQLVTRRSRLVTSLSRLYQLGPRAAVDPFYRAQQLEESYNQRWYMGIEGAPPHHDSLGLYQGSDGLLSIVGLELTPSLVELVKNGVIGWSSDPELCQRAAAVLGYVAHFASLCSKYLDIPLRYPIEFKGSMSLIYNWAPSEDRSSALQGPWVSVQRQKPSSSGEVTPFQAPVEYTLYYQGNTRSKFAFAVFLLGKDVQQLLAAHDIKPSGSKYLLENLYSLVAAAYSGLIHCTKP